MWKLSCAVLLLSAALTSRLQCSAFVTGDDDAADKENLLQVEGFGNEEVKESNMLMKCYDDETKSAYKIDSVWYPVGKCEKRICSRQRDSKTPYIKVSTCEPCTTCNSPNHTCHPFKVEKNYPKCCPKCLTQFATYKKTETKKKHYTI